MVAQLTRGERQLAIVVLTLVALVRTGHGRRRARRPDRRARRHRDGGKRRADLRRAFLILRAGAVARAARPLLRRSQQGRHRPLDGLGGCRHVPRRVGRGPARLARPHIRRGVGEFRPVAARPYQRGHLRFRRECADRHLLPCSPAHVARAAAGSVHPVVRTARLQSFLRGRGGGLLHGSDPVEGVRGTRMVRRYLAGHRLGDLFRHLYPHAGAAEGTAHLRRQLVLHGVHPGCRDPAHREQSCRPGVVRTCQELFGLLGRPGRDDAVVVRPQRGRLLPDRRVPRHDVLLPAEACRAADLFVQAFHHQLLGHHLHVHVGRFPPPALHGAAAMGSDARHDVLAGPAGALLGFGRKRARYAQRRLAQGSRRRDASLHDGGGGVLWTEHVRRVVPGDPRGQLAVALHGLDRRTRPRGRVGLGRIDHVRLDLQCRSLALETRAHVFGKAGGSPLLVGAFQVPSSTSSRCGIPASSRG